MVTETDVKINLPITFNDAALKELRKIKESELDIQKSLRVGVKGGGCSGMTYVLEFDAKTQFDEVYQIKDMEFVVDKRHLMYLLGMEVQFQDGLNARGFVFHNPNAKTTCGCGTSFSA